MKGFLIRYRYRGAKPSPSYDYQKFFRALYGYTQVVVKSTGRSYVYYREGVLTTFPYVRKGRNIIIVPDNALQPTIEFFKTGKNPAHDFENLDNWSVSYYIEETNVDDTTALRAIYSAMNRIMLRLPTGYVRLRDAVQTVSPTPEELSGILTKARNIIGSNWFISLVERDPLLTLLNERYMQAQRIL